MVDPSSPNWSPVPKRDHRAPLAWWKYLPLMIVVVATLATAAIGFITNRLPDPVVSGTDWVPPSTAEPADSAPDVCRGEMTDEFTSPWLAGDNVEGDAVLAEHAGELDGMVVAGEDGFATFSNTVSDNFSQAIGQRLLSDDEIQRWTDYLASVESELAAEQIPFVMMIAAADWSVYDQALPTWAQTIRGDTVADQLLLSNPNAPILDTRPALRTAATDEWVYSGINSHWTDFGALTAANALARCLTDENTFDVPVPELTPASVATLPNDQVDEFGQHGFESPDEERWTVPVFEPPLHEVELTFPADGSTVTDGGTTRVSILQLPVATATAEAPVDATVLVLRDSFGDFLAPYLQQTFSQTYQVRHNLDADPSQQPDLAQLIAEVQPDLVILEVAERNLIWAPPAR